MEGMLAAPPPIPIRVSLALPSALWNQLLAQALSRHASNRDRASRAPCEPEFEAVVGAARAFESCPRPPAVLLTALPANREAWERLGQWCRRGEGERGVRVLVLGENRSALAARALRLGAAGYLDAESPLAVLEKAIRSVHAGELWAERRIAFSLLRGSGAASRRALTPRELHVLEALAEGKRNKEIAALLAISETTVKSHLNRAYHKLQLSDRLQAALYVERHGLGG